MLRTDINNDLYHSSKELSRSRASSLLSTSPAHVRQQMLNPNPSTPALVMGGCFHTAVLEPMKLDEEFGEKPAEIDGYGPRTNAYKEAFKEMENEYANKQWLSPSEFNTCMEMAGAALDNPILKDYMSDLDTIIEGTGYFDFEGADCKVRPDIYVPGAEVVIDLKSTQDASEKGFARSVRKFGYDFQACWYLEGLKRMGYNPKTFIFVAVEKTPPYANACYTLSAYDIARQMEPMRRACRIWKECIDTDVWPGYADELKTLDLTNDWHRLSMQEVAKKFNVGRHFVYKIVEKYAIETKYIANKRTVDLNDFAMALKWDAEGKEVA